MSVAYNTSIVTNNLLLALDAANQKSLNIPSQSDHGYADWYCLVSGTVTYSIINSTGGVIYERNGSTITVIVAATGPERGTFSVTAGRFYYGSVPINLVVEDGHQCMVPLTMAGTQFWNVAIRSNPSMYYVYSPYQTATVNFYDNTAGGLTGTPNFSLSVSAGQTVNFSSNNLTNHWISSNVPVVATVSQTGQDRTILSPMSTYVYQRYQNYLNTTNSTTPTNNNAYVTYDSTYKVMNMSIADGSGGDCAQGLGLEYLSDTYSWGNVVSDYIMVFPYNGTFTASYWSGSSWIVWDAHTITNGSITNPPRIFREGTTGPGVEGTTASGLATNMASGATLWKWEGTAPFYLGINDSVDDEFSVLGWNSSTKNNPRSGNIINDMSGRGSNGTLLNGPIFVKDNGGSLVFDGSNDSIDITGLNLRQDFTFECWVNHNVVNGFAFLGQGTILTNRGLNIWFRDGSNLRFGMYGNDTDALSLTTSTGIWYHYCFTYNHSTYAKQIYRNGVQLTGTTQQTQSQYAGTGTVRIGATYSSEGAHANGYFSNVRIYNRVLSSFEIQQNFNTLKTRFGI